MAVTFFPDTTVVCNFAAVDRLDLFVDYLNGRGRIVEAVAYEISRSATILRALAALDVDSVFGAPIELDNDPARHAIEVSRTAVFGGMPSRPLEHLGESQTLYVLGARPEFSDSIWITDDKQANRLGQRRGFITRDTVHMLEELVANREISCSVAFDLTEVMWRQGRSLLSRPLAPSFFG